MGSLQRASRMNGLQRRLQELALELIRPAPALYLFCATWELMRAAALSAGVLFTHRARSNTSSLAVPATAAVSSLVPPAAAHSLSNSCCLPRATAFSRCITGQQQADACSAALTSLLQRSAMHRLLSQQHHLHLQQHHQPHHHRHHCFDDVRRYLLFGRSTFALFAAEPSREAWLTLLKTLEAPEDLPGDRPHELLLPRRSGGGLPMQPRWVARRVSIQTC